MTPDREVEIAKRLATTVPGQPWHSARLKESAVRDRHNRLIADVSPMCLEFIAHSADDIAYLLAEVELLRDALGHYGRRSAWDGRVHEDGPWTAREALRLATMAG